MKTSRFFALVLLAAVFIGLPRTFAADPVSGWAPLSSSEISTFTTELAKVKVSKISVHYEPDEAPFARSLVAVTKKLKLPEARIVEARPEQMIVVTGIDDDPAPKRIFELLQKHFPAGAVKFSGYKFFPTVHAYGFVDVYVGSKPL